MILSGRLLGKVGGCRIIFAGMYSNNELIPIAYEKKVIKARSGICYVPKAAVIEAIKFDNILGLIIPGGWNDEQRPELTELINKLNKENKLIAAICAGPQFLARAGILKGRKYTTTLVADAFEGKDDPFPRDSYIKQNVVRDKNIITAVGDSFVDFAIEIGDYFNIFEDKKEKIECANTFKGII
jgi:putative intracellular protease/amidase